MRDINDLPPFLKWAGGKRWLVAQLDEIFPSTYNRYIEPFLGGGAAFFALRPDEAILSDLNAELINCYAAIRNNWSFVQRLLEKHQQSHRHDYYYEVRDKKLRGPIQRAARFLYLNRTCWNGLYRVNLKGRFNVPIGTKDSVLLETDDFKATSQILKRATIYCRDFEETIDLARRNDLIFIDPPYTVRHNCNGFIKYNEKLFSWDDQVRLRDAAVRAISRGAKVLITNANHPSVRELYASFAKLTPVTRRSVLAADPSYRSEVEELLIQSWQS